MRPDRAGAAHFACRLSARRTEIAALIGEAAIDRRMEKAHVKVNMGGASAAVESYRTSPTPNVIVIETSPTAMS